MIDPFDTHSSHFGFQKVDPQDRQGLVGQVFKNVASRYDLMNDLMSFGMHRLWKKTLLEMIRPRSNMRVVDVAGGTGDIALGLHKKTRQFSQPAQIYVCDFSPQMVMQGRQRADNQGVFSDINWICGDGAQLPFPENWADVVTISFGLRNITDLEKALKEAYRVLKPGGQYFCLEFSKIDHAQLKKIYEHYSFNVIPILGKWIAGDEASYQYLVESIAQFPDQESLISLLQGVGFQQVSCTNLSQGIVAIHSGLK